MALKKEIELENGVVLNYHRISSLNKITNISNIIEVNSYVSESQRDKEYAYQQLQIKNATIAAALAAQEVQIDEDGTLVSSDSTEQLTAEEQEILNKGINVLVKAHFITLPYDESMTIEAAYEYLKNTEKFENAENA